MYSCVTLRTTELNRVAHKKYNPKLTVRVYPIHRRSSTPSPYDKSGQNYTRESTLQSLMDQQFVAERHKAIAEKDAVGARLANKYIGYQAVIVY